MDELKGINVVKIQAVVREMRKVVDKGSGLYEVTLEGFPAGDLAIVKTWGDKLPRAADLLEGAWVQITGAATARAYNGKYYPEISVQKIVVVRDAPEKKEVEQKELPVEDVYEEEIPF